MNKIYNVADRAAAELINGLNAANPDHKPLHSIGLSRESKPTQVNEISALGAYVTATGAVIALATSVAEAVVGGTHEATNIGVGLGLGGIAVGAVVYGLGRATEQ